MPRERRLLDVTHNPELMRVAREVQQTRTARILQADGEDLAEIAPLSPRARLPRGRRTSADDPIWDIIGMISTNAPDNVSERVDAYLADAELAQHHRP